MLADYIVPGVVIAFVGWRIASSLRVRRRLPALIKEGAQLVDVRSEGEFAGGHAPGTINIPLHELEARAVARRRLCGLGFERVLNAGSWRTLG